MILGEIGGGNVVFEVEVWELVAMLMAMRRISCESLLEALRWRYATKVFDKERVIEDEVWRTLEGSLVLTPSSYGLQPWRFVVVQDRALRETLRKHSWNQPQVTDCSHYVVFGAKIKIEEADVDRLVELMARMRGVTVESLGYYREMIMGDVVRGARAAMAMEWAARQCYIALGNLMTCAAVLGVDACPMEGIDTKAYDEVLGLPAMGYRTAVACAVGYRAAEDKYAKVAKVRYEAGELMVYR
jgi:nitroreductase